MSNKSTKKGLKIATSAALVASVIVPVASVGAQTFKDVDSKNIFKSEIEFLYDRNIVKGYADGTFKPNNNFTRGEVVYLLGQYLTSFGKTIPSDYRSSVRFNDLNIPGMDDNLLKYAALVHDSGVFSGRANGSLDFRANITREEAAAVMVRLLGNLLDVNIVEFAKQRSTYTENISDINQAAAMMRPNIYALKELGITRNTTFYPRSNIKRGEYAAFIHRSVVDVLENQTLRAEITRYKNQTPTTPGAITLGTLAVHNAGAELKVTGAKANQKYEVYRGSTKIGEATIANNGSGTIAISPRLITGESVKIKVSEGTTTKEFDYNVTSVFQPIGPITNNDETIRISLTSLKAIIDAITNMDSSDYTPETWERLMAIVEGCYRYFNDPTVTYVQIDAAIDDLLNAIRNLQPADGSNAEKISSLKETITNLSNLVNGLNSELYTTETWNNVTAALSAARVLLTKTNVTVNELLTAINTLIDAINGLILKSDQDEDGLSDELLAQLNRLVAEMRALNRLLYTADSWANLETKLALADGTYANDAEITSIISQITDAKNALVVKGDKATLRALIELANSSLVEESPDGMNVLPSKKWTTSAVRQTFISAINAAQVVHDNANATEQQLAAAANALQQAMNVYVQAQQDGKQILSVASQVLSTSLESSTIDTNARLGGITNGNVDINFATLGVGVGGVVDLNALGNTATNTKFTVPEDKRFSMGFSFTLSGVVGTGQMFLNILKDKGNGQFELVWRDGLNYFTLLGIPLQNKYAFSVADLEPGDYVFVAEKGTNLNLNVIAGSAFALNSSQTFLTDYSGEVNTQAPVVTTGITGNLLTVNNLTTATADVTAVNNIALSPGAKVITSPHGTMEVTGDTGAFTYKSFGKPTSIGQVDIFEYEVTHTDGRKGKEKVYVQYGGTANGTALPVTFSSTNPGQPYTFNTASAKTGFVALTKGANQTGSPITNVPVRSALWASVSDTFDGTYNFDITGHDNIIAFDPYVGGSSNDTLRYRFIDESGTLVKFADGKDYFDIDTSMNKRVEVQGLNAGRYRVKVQSLEKGNYYFGMSNVLITRSTWDEGPSTGNLSQGNVVTAGSKLVVNGVTVNNANTYVYGQYGRLTVSPDGTYSYDTEYTQQRPNSAITTDSYEPRSEMIGKTEQFVYYYLAPNGSIAKSTLSISITSNDQPLSMTPTSHQVKTASMASPTALNLQYTVLNQVADAGSTVDYE